jgi:hypothetical protein
MILRYSPLHYLFNVKIYTVFCHALSPHLLHFAYFPHSPLQHQANPRLDRHDHFFRMSRCVSIAHHHRHHHRHRRCHRFIISFIMLVLAVY